MQKLVVDEKCIGCGACCAIDSEHFDFDNNLGTSIVISQENLDTEPVKEAIDACPVGAIYIAEAECENCPNCTCQKEEHKDVDNTEAENTDEILATA